MSLTNPAFRKIFENAPVGIVVIDAELRIVDANAAYCAMLGYTREELMSLTVPEYTHPEDRQRDIEFVPLLLSGRLAQYRAEKRYIRKTGEVVWGHLTGAALFDKDGRGIYAFGFVEDITERKLLRQLVPWCPSCKRVRDEHGLWSEADVYLREHALANVSESRCPSCSRKAGG